MHFPASCLSPERMPQKRKNRHRDRIPAFLSVLVSSSFHSRLSQTTWLNHRNLYFPSSRGQGVSRAGFFRRLCPGLAGGCLLSVSHVVFPLCLQESDTLLFFCEAALPFCVYVYIYIYIYIYRQQLEWIRAHPLGLILT